MPSALGKCEECGLSVPTGTMARVVALRPEPDPLPEEVGELFLTGVRVCPRCAGRALIAPTLSNHDVRTEPGRWHWRNPNRLSINHDKRG